MRCASKSSPIRRSWVLIRQDAQMTPWPKDLLKEWSQLTPEEQKLFIHQADVFAAYFAYTDHEIGRVIDEIDKEGKLDNTLVIYIAGDNGNSAEGTLVGAPNEVAALNGSPRARRRPDEVLRRLGLRRGLSDMAVGWSCLRHAVLMDQADHVALGRGAAGHGDFMAEGHSREWWNPKSVPPRHRHVTTILEATGIPAPTVVDGYLKSPSKA